ncbi:MAG TPA: hypothetical protein VNG51_10215 [Ktedonobacteraceae bacterium]|nr:hypothetical protein [Ktedonobacteraceae bacterium]
MTQMNPLLKSIGVTIGSPPTVRCEISDPEYPYYQCGTSASVHIDAIQVRTDAGNTLLALTGLDNQLSKMGWRKDDASLPPSPTLLAHTLDESGLTLEYTYYHSGIHCQLAFTIGQHPQASTNWQPVQSLYCDKNVPR